MAAGPLAAVRPLRAQQHVHGGRHGHQREGPQRGGGEAVGGEGGRLGSAAHPRGFTWRQRRELEEHQSNFLFRRAVPLSQGGGVIERTDRLRINTALFI